jgi:DNA-binding beta-propeller fold protein YncE
MFTILSITPFVKNAPAGSNSADSITITPDGFVWVAYTNGADSTGASGSSTVVEYDSSGQPVTGQSYTIPGYVDGLKFNPNTGQIWALQNQDGNSTLTIINPATQSMSGPLSYGSGYVYGSNSGRGFDDVVFDGNNVFLSETNASAVGDPIIVELVNSNGNGLGAGSQRTLVTKTVLTDPSGPTGQPLILDPDLALSW